MRPRSRFECSTRLQTRSATRLVSIKALVGTPERAALAVALSVGLDVVVMLPASADLASPVLDVPSIRVAVPPSGKTCLTCPLLVGKTVNCRLCVRVLNIFAMILTGRMFYDYNSLINVDRLRLTLSLTRTGTPSDPPSSALVSRDLTVSKLPASNRKCEKASTPLQKVRVGTSSGVRVSSLPLEIATRPTSKKRCTVVRASHPPPPSGHPPGVGHSLGISHPLVTPSKTPQAKYTPASLPSHPHSRSKSR